MNALAARTWSRTSVVIVSGSGCGRGCGRGISLARAVPWSADGWRRAASYLVGYLSKAMRGFRMLDRDSLTPAHVTVAGSHGS